jgi:hypothetical protein
VRLLLVHRTRTRCAAKAIANVSQLISRARANHPPTWPTKTLNGGVIQMGATWDVFSYSLVRRSALPLRPLAIVSDFEISALLGNSTWGPPFHWRWTQRTYKAAALTENNLPWFVPQLTGTGRTFKGPPARRRSGYSQSG